MAFALIYIMNGETEALLGTTLQELSQDAVVTSSFFARAHLRARVRVGCVCACVRSFRFVCFFSPWLRKSNRFSSEDLFVIRAVIATPPITNDTIKRHGKKRRKKNLQEQKM